MYRHHAVWGLALWLSCALAVLVFPATAARATPVATEVVVYANTFSSAVGSEWSLARMGTTPLKTATYGGFLGPFSKAPSSGDESVTLMLSEMPSGLYHVTFDLLIIKSWDGVEEFHDAVADRWSVGLDGHAPLLVTSFSKNLNRQTYPDSFNPALYDLSNPNPAARYTGPSHPADTAAFEKNQLGFTFPGVGIQDAVYKMDFVFPLADPNMVLRFAGLGLDSAADAGWGLDNVVVARVPEPATLLSALLGALALLAAARGMRARRG